MSAHADDDHPGGIDDAVFVVLWVAELRQVDLGLGRDLLLGSVANEQGLSSPLERHVLPFGDIAQLDLDFGQGQNIGRGAHGGDELGHGGLCSINSQHCRGACDQIGENLARITAVL